LAGGQVGFNWQVNAAWVLGIEADIDWANLKGSGSSFFHLGSTENTTANATETVTSFGTVRGRVGFLPTAPLMIFGTGGLAYGTVTSNLLVPNNIPAATGSSGNVGGFSYSCSAGGPACFTGNSSTTRVGWTVGAGAEYLITNNWSVKAEYLYAALGRFNSNATTSVALGGTTPSSFNANYGSINLNIVRVGVNYKFGGPVVARY
jgi:outer membrane immunogenic protein